TDKVDSEIPAPASGTVREILVKEGQTVQINTVVAVIGDGESASASAPVPEQRAASVSTPSAPPQVPPAAKEAPKPPEQKAPPAPTPPPATPPPPRPMAAPSQPQPQAQPQAVERGEFRSSPLVRRIARENKVDLNSLAGKGTGINGRITKRDILSYIEQAPA